MYPNIPHYLLLAALPLIGAATASTILETPATGAIVALLEAQGLASWTADIEGGGRHSHFTNAAWDAAEAQVLANLGELANTTSHEQQPGQNRRGLIELRADGELSDGISDSGGTKHAAHWYCYGSGSSLYNFVLPATTVPLCGAAAATLESLGTGKWIWSAEVRPDEDSPINPGNSPRQIYVKLSKHLGVIWGVTICNTAVTSIINQQCKAPERKRETITHGGRVDIYEGKVDDWDQGELAMQLSISIENM